MLSWLLEQCADELVSLVGEEVGEGKILERIAKKIDDLFGSKESPLQKILPGQFMRNLLPELKEQFSHRQINIETYYEDAPPVMIPEDVLKKVIAGLIKNAVENTPDQGKIEISVQTRGKGAELTVRDYGVGITRENRDRIFEGFFTTQETMDYSSKRPFDFNAGGKGADLLRMKIFSERYGFDIIMNSARCAYIPTDKDKCPGRIGKCGFCKKVEDCLLSGGTIFRVFFPESSGEEKRSVAFDS
jgi:signal transduction histidine kinase